MNGQTVSLRESSTELVLIRLIDLVNHRQFLDNDRPLHVSEHVGGRTKDVEDIVKNAISSPPSASESAKKAA